MEAMMAVLCTGDTGSIVIVKGGTIQSRATYNSEQRRLVNHNTLMVIILTDGCRRIRENTKNGAPGVAKDDAVGCCAGPSLKGGFFGQPGFQISACIHQYCVTTATITYGSVGPTFATSSKSS